ncbi:MAG: YicC family protein [Kiritimatiellales bacterium]|nr:YicC family protein [Kiritimatiellota bacterium]MBL7012408.1 YicC family protein [Kiritimatiellales bacterium]
MALKSMTGFGAATAKADGVQISVELSSVNRKQLDVSLRLPTALAGMEAHAQNIIKETVSRGRITGVVQLEAASGQGEAQLDLKKAEAAVKQLRAAAKKLKLEDNLSASDLLRVPNLFQTAAVEKSAEEFSQPLEKALTAALKKLDAMRAREGKALGADFRERLKTLETMLAEISRLAPAVVSNHREKLFQGLENCGIENIEKDERIIREIALFGEKADISEEITRLKSHIQQFRKMMRSPEPAGRPLDFLAQEFFREINTIGSKANDLQITEQVVAFKTELERIREQVQNVE